MTNLARFTVNGSASTNLGVDVLNDAAASFALETPTSEVWKVTFSVADAADVNAPLASKDADELVLDNGAGSTGTSVDAATVAGAVTTTWPATGVHSYIVRCKVNNGVNTDGSVNSDYVFERMCSIRTAEGARKTVSNEATQYSARGEADAQNDLVDAFLSAGAWITAGTLNQILQHNGTGWAPGNSLLLPAGAARTIGVAATANGSGVDLTLAAPAGDMGEDDGNLYILDGSGNQAIRVFNSVHADTGASVTLSCKPTEYAMRVVWDNGLEVVKMSFFDEIPIPRPTYTYMDGSIDADLAEILTKLDAIGILDVTVTPAS